MADPALDVVVKRRADREKGRRVCTACGSSSTLTGHGAAGTPYRILRGGMHVGNLVLDPHDPLCRFCDASGAVRKYGVGGV